MTAISVKTNRLPSISTHILTKRMTSGRLDSPQFVQTFQLTSSRRGWQYSTFFLPAMYSISTHILTKRMTVITGKGKEHGSISTHILTKRMTILVVLLVLHLNISTHILTKRMTLHPLMFPHCRIVFQLTSSRRGWHFGGAVGLAPKYFNSHPHEEDDNTANWNITVVFISTHILTKRMTW